MSILPPDLAESPLWRSYPHGILPVEINIKGTPDALRVLVDQKFIESALTDMLDLVREGVTSDDG